MKTVVVSDLITIKKYLWQQIVVGIAVGAVVGIATESIYVVVPCLTVMTAFSLTFSLLALDERNKWEQFRVALPLSRTDIALGRYLSCGLFSLIGFVVGVVVTGALLAAGAVLPGVAKLGIMLAFFSPEDIALASAVSLAIALVMTALVLPLFMRFGMTRAVRIIPIVAVCGILIVFAASHGGGDAAQVVHAVGTWMELYAGPWGIAGIVLAATLAVYTASAALSVRLYRRKEL